jgi:hypothetical protein
MLSLSLETATLPVSAQYKQKAQRVRSQSYGTCVRGQPAHSLAYNRSGGGSGGGTCGRMEGANVTTGLLKTRFCDFSQHIIPSFRAPRYGKLHTRHDFLP